MFPMRSKLKQRPPPMRGSSGMQHFVATERPNMIRTVVLSALVVSSLAQAADQLLRVSAIPDESPTELQRKFAPLEAYLEKATGMKMSFVPVTDYAATV